MFTVQQLAAEKVSSIDVFEDQVRGWVLDFAEELARKEDSGIAVLMLATSYLEPIERFRSGQVNADSGQLFKRSVRRVFPEIDATSMPERVAGILFDHLRAGLFHAGLIKPLLVLVPKGEPIRIELANQKMWAIKINAARFLGRVMEDFKDYICQLRSGKDQQLLDNFNKMWRERGGLLGSSHSAHTTDLLPASGQTGTATNTSPSIDPNRFMKTM